MCGVGFSQDLETDPSATRIHSIISKKERMIVVRANPQSFESIIQRGCRVSSERVRFASVEEG